MAEEAPTEEVKETPTVDNEARFRAERDRAKAKLADAEALLAKLQEADSARAAADEKAEADRKKKAGEFESLESELRTKAETANELLAKHQERIAVYEARDQSRLEKILEGRDDADEIKATFEGLPIDRQLVLAEKFLASAAASPAGPSGTPGSSTSARVPDWVEDMAKRDYPDEKERKRFIANYIQTQEDKKKIAGDGWPVSGSKGATS